jgi:hypothetical protein
MSITRFQNAGRSHNMTSSCILDLVITLYYVVISNSFENLAKFKYLRTTVACHNETSCLKCEFYLLILPCRYPCFDVVVGLAWSYDPESYAGGNIAAGRASHAGQVKGNDPDKKGYPDPPSWGFGVGLTAPPRKKL